MGIIGSPKNQVKIERLYSLNNNNNNKRNILVKHKYTCLSFGIVSLQVNMCPLCSHQNEVYVRDYFLYRWKRIFRSGQNLK